MEILFLGSVVTPVLAERLSGTSIAGNKMQYCVLKELSKIEDVNISAITVKCRAAFPKDRVIFEERDTIEIETNVKGYCAAYCNIPIIKQIWHTVSMYLETRRYIKKEGAPDVILSFNLFPQTGWAAVKSGKKYNIPVATLLADLPIDDANKRNWFMTQWRKLFDCLTIRLIKECKNIIALNENAIKIYHPKADSLIVDGGIDWNSNNTLLAIKGAENKDIVFAGALVQYNGIVNLLQAMQIVKKSGKDIILHIYGDGDLKDYVKAMAEKHDNIVFHGRVASEELTEIYNKAWLLINPRPVNDPISQVTFPSKMFEYLLSGTPVLSTRLSGFTNDYNDVMFFAESDTPQGLADKILEVSCQSQEEMNQKALRARKFVLDNKTWEKQCERIHEYLQKIADTDGRR